MLPTEAFADAIAFLRLFDLSALTVSNALCSSLAVKASSRIRCEQFPGLHFYILKKSIGIYRSESPEDPSTVRLRFPDETATLEFLVAALPNCIFDDVEIFSTSKPLLDTISRVAESVVVKGGLFLPATVSRDESLELVREFREVKALELLIKVSDVEANELANFYRESGLQELWYYRPSAEDETQDEKVVISFA